MSSCRSRAESDVWLASTAMGAGTTQALSHLAVSDEVRHYTPGRVGQAWAEMLGGYALDPAEVLGKVFTDAEYDEIVLVKDINFTSICEHHMLPFSGRAHVGYLPEDDRIIGLSKLARLVDCFARRLQIQERLTQDIATALNDHVRSAGVAVVISASHGCMRCRGVRQQDSSTVTSVMTGKFREYGAARAEVLSMIGLA